MEEISSWELCINMGESKTSNVSVQGYLGQLKSFVFGGQSTWANSICLFDNLRAIAIFAICFRHALGHGVFGDSSHFIDFLANAGALFAIPVFAFASGYGQKNLNDTSFFPRLLSIYIAANLVNIPYYLWESHKDGFHVWYYAFLPGPAGLSGVYIWYFLALLLWRIITPFFIQMRQPLLFSVILAVACTPDLMLLMRKWSGTQESELLNAALRPIYFTIKFFPFYLAGLLASREQILWLRNFRAKLLLLLVSVIGLYLCGKNYVVYYSFPDTWRAHTTAYFILAFFALAAMVAFVPGKPIRWLTFIGQRSFAIYFLHILLIEVLVIAMRKVHVIPDLSFAGPILELLVVGVWTYLICYFLSRKPFTDFVQFLSQKITWILFPKALPTTNVPVSKK